VELLRAVIFAVAHLCNGSLGLAVCIVSIALRLALLPLTLRLARRALAHQRRILELKPQIDRLKKRYESDPVALLNKTSALYEKNGIKMIDPAGMWGGLAQAPIFGALYAALRRGIGAGARFFWIGDLSAPNFALTILVAGVTAGTMLASPSPSPDRRALIMPLLLTAGVTIWFLMSSSALFALASGAGSAVNVLQGFILRSERARSSVEVE
jgi:YidC/Oxa1 family membrane protein insertase